MKKTALAAALLIASSTSQAATLSPNSAYSMSINTTGSCFAFGDCTTLVDNVSAGAVINITTTDDSAGGVNFSVTSATNLFYENTPGGLFTMTGIGGTGSVDAAGNVTYTPTGRLGAAEFFAYLGTPAWNIDDSSPNAAPGYVNLTSGTMTNLAFIDTDGDTVADTWITNDTLTGATLDAGLNATIVSVANIGSGWGSFVNTPYSEVWSVTFALTNSSPIANNDSVNVDQSTTDNIISVFANNGNGIDEDPAPNATTISISSVGTPSNGGTASISGDTILYSPPASLGVSSDSFTYTITDGTFSSTATVSVTINDITPPAITLIGTDPFPIAQNATYTEPGANCTDNFDATKPAIVAGDTVNTAIAATYVVTYNCSDTAGLDATQVTRDVVVSANNLPPVITVNGADPLELTVTPGNADSYTQVIANSDVSCADDRDTPILTNNALVQVDTSTLSTSIVTYSCIDLDSPALTADTVNRTVNVIDNVAPVVTANGTNTTNVVVGNAYVEQGAACSDNFDISPALFISPAENTVDTSAIGITTTITYTCTDASGNTDVATIDVVTISTGPLITLNGVDPVTLFLGQAYVEEDAVCSDDVDVDSIALISGDTVNTSVPGVYTVRYNCSDSDGNNATEVTRTVNVVADAEAPVITLNDEAVINLKLGFTYFEQGAVCSDNLDADKSADISGDTITTDAVATFNVLYNCADVAGNNAVEVVRTVNVFKDEPVVATNSDDEKLSGSVSWLSLTGLISLILLARRKNSINQS